MCTNFYFFFAAFEMIFVVPFPSPSPADFFWRPTFIRRLCTRRHFLLVQEELKCAGGGKYLQNREIRPPGIDIFDTENISRGFPLFYVWKLKTNLNSVQIL